MSLRKNDMPLMHASCDRAIMTDHINKMEQTLSLLLPIFLPLLLSFRLKQISEFGMEN